MLGWEIFIHNELSDSTNQSDWKWPKQESVLATWRAGLSGINWLNKLVEEGNATCLGGNGYPVRFLAKVKVILPLIKSGPPSHRGPLVIGDDYVTPSGWISGTKIHLDMFANEDPENTVVIDAWDES